MQKTFLLVMMMLGVAFAGCLGGGDGDGSGDNETGGNGTDGGGDGGGNDTGDDGAQVNFTAGNLSVSIDQYPENVSENEAIQITWTVDTASEASASGNASGNGTSANATVGNESETVEETGLVWGYESVSMPNDTSAYANVEAAFTDVEVPNQFSANFSTDGGNASGNGTGNGTGGGNGSGNASGDVIYVRAYVTQNGTTTFSDEVEIQIERLEPVYVEIGGGLAPYLDEYDPSEVTVKVGQAVIWRNEGDGAHTATSTSGPEEFDTGDIPSGEESDPIIFTQPGTYEYECENHATMDGGTITVEA